MYFCSVKESFEDKSRARFHKLIPGALNKGHTLIKSDSSRGNLHSQRNITPNRFRKANGNLPEFF